MGDIEITNGKAKQQSQAASSFVLGPERQAPIPIDLPVTMLPRGMTPTAQKGEVKARRQYEWQDPETGEWLPWIVVGDPGTIGRLDALPYGRSFTIPLPDRELTIRAPWSQVPIGQRIGDSSWRIADDPDARNIAWGALAPTLPDQGAQPLQREPQRNLPGSLSPVSNVGVNTFTERVRQAIQQQPAPIGSKESSLAAALTDVAPRSLPGAGRTAPNSPGSIGTLGPDLRSEEQSAFRRNQAAETARDNARTERALDWLGSLIPSAVDAAYAATDVPAAAIENFIFRRPEEARRILTDEMGRGTTRAFGRAFQRAAAPGLAGLAGFEAAAAPVGAYTLAATKNPIAAGIAATSAGLLGSFGLGYLVQEGQDSLNRVMLGDDLYRLYQQQSTEDRTLHPDASRAGDAAAVLITNRPPSLRDTRAVISLLRGNAAPEVAALAHRTLANMALGSALQPAIGYGMAKAQGLPYTGTDFLWDAGTGGLGSGRDTRFGAGAKRFGAGTAERLGLVRGAERAGERTAPVFRRTAELAKPLFRRGAKQATTRQPLQESLLQQYSQQQREPLFVRGGRPKAQQQRSATSSQQPTSQQQSSVSTTWTPSTRFTSVGEAHNYLLSKGVKYVNFDTRLDIANLAIDAFDQLYAKGIAYPDLIYVAPEHYFDTPGRRDAVAAVINGFVGFNPLAPYWKNPAGQANLLHSTGFWSTNHPLHPLFHEAGHWALAQREGEKRPEWLQQEKHTGDTEAIARSVSKYAAEDMGEFLSETLVRLLTGQSVSPKAFELYQKYGGLVPDKNGKIPPKKS